jgi:hypothetical protein
MPLRRPGRRRRSGADHRARRCSSKGVVAPPLDGILASSKVRASPSTTVVLFPSIAASIACPAADPPCASIRRRSRPWTRRTAADEGVRVDTEEADHRLLWIEYELSHKSSATSSGELQFTTSLSVTCTVAEYRQLVSSCGYHEFDLCLLDLACYC